MGSGRAVERHAQRRAVKVRNSFVDLLLWTGIGVAAGLVVEVAFARLASVAGSGTRTSR